MGGTMVLVTPALLMASSSSHGLSKQPKHTKTMCCNAAAEAPSGDTVVICPGCHRMGAEQLMQKRALYVVVR